MVIACAGVMGAGQTLPVFLADNHADSFGWIARTFDPDEAHSLVLVDAHSDATAAERSEEIREGLRRVPSQAARDANVMKWRGHGRIQAYNWIEPLMPRPLDRVVWVAGRDLTEPRRSKMHHEAVTSLDGRLEVEPRSAGSFADRWATIDAAELASWHPGKRPVILALDLDAFAGMAALDREREFQQTWTQAMSWPGLAGVAVAVSRPWLESDAEADALVSLVCDAVLRTRGAVLEIDASVDDRPDDSLRGTAGGEVPRWDAARASVGLRARWALLRERLVWLDRKRDWRKIAGGWDAAQGTIRPDAGEMDCDGVWRYRMDAAPVLRVVGLEGATGRVRWHALKPSTAAVDLVPETGLGKGFADVMGRWLHEAREFLTETADLALPPSVYQPRGAGRVRLAAEAETAAGWLPVGVVELRFADRGGFRGALSECFGMPYVFGVAGVREGDFSGVETGWGSDCANFLVHAWRRNGLPLGWGDPGSLRAQLQAKHENLTLADSPRIRADEIELGLAIDFGNHVAALWEDLEPVGTLGGNDRVAHHLGGLPEIVRLADLTGKRPAFALRVPRSAGKSCRVKIAGDVVLAGDARHVIDGFVKGDTDLFLANLEGVPSIRKPPHAPRFDFRFPVERLVWLKAQGVDAVSLANNHAEDAGERGLCEGIQALAAAGLGVFGAGRNEREACEPWRFERFGVRVAVFGICLVDAMTATADLPGVASLPAHAGLLEDSITRAAMAGEQVIVMVHGGDEYRQQVNDAQRRWAAWLVERGARVLAGSHPHVVQRGEWHGGAFLAHSLGNAVYPHDLRGSDSGETRVFHLHADGRVSR